MYLISTRAEVEDAIIKSSFAIGRVSRLSKIKGVIAEERILYPKNRSGFILNRYETVTKALYLVERYFIK
jgi:hypothetical protein